MPERHWEPWQVEQWSVYWSQPQLEQFERLWQRMVLKDHGTLKGRQSGRQLLVEHCTRYLEVPLAVVQELDRRCLTKYCGGQL